MKKYSIIVLSLICVLSGCSKDALNLTPTQTTGPDMVFATTTSSRMAVNGLAKLMYCQQLGSQGYNGEGTVCLYHGEYPGIGMSVANLTAFAPTINGENREDNTDKVGYHPWFYYYKLIGNANAILDKIDNAEGPDTEKNFIKAQTLAYRAFAYMRLSQIFCCRWSDSNNGSAQGLPLRLDISTGDLPLKTIGEVYTQIYKDLDESIDLFGKAGNIKRSSCYEMGIDVAYAIYARAALLKQDYQKALDFAKKARANYPLMTIDEYKSGFCDANQEWIWGLVGLQTEDLRWYTYAAYVAYNADAAQVRNYQKLISKELFDQIPASDKRKCLWLDPGTMEYSKSNGLGGAELNDYSQIYAASDGRKGFCPGNGIVGYAYMQFKFAARIMPGIADYCVIRSSEMLLIEAECNYMLKNEKAAQDLLVELNRTSGRDPEYNCSKTGADLFEEIKLYRAFDLWGEGFSWFDLKRWGDSVHRKSYEEGGNFMASFAVNYGPKEKNNWVWVIPERETNYNHAL